MFTFFVSNDSIDCRTGVYNNDYSETSLTYNVCVATAAVYRSFPSRYDSRQTRLGLVYFHSDMM